METTTTIATAIRESITHDRIVTLEGDEAMHDELLALADDSAEQGDLTEYWGTDDDGHAWRVHASRLHRCECGEATGVRCEWTGAAEALVTIEWMPPQFRASHAAAGNAGEHPHNGALRLRVSEECAAMLSDDAE